VHWLIYNIPATTAGVPAGIPIDPAAPMPEGLAGAVQGMSGFRRAMYRGPAPPGGPPHEYHFMVYALDVVLPLPAGADRAAFLEAIDGHVLGRGEIVPVYGRPATPASPGGRGRGRGGEE
jgi:Raf kinase inhibitor-like YbhB/YbcL family protein